MAEKIYDRYGNEIGTLERRSGCDGLLTFLGCMLVLILASTCCTTCLGIDPTTPSTESSPAPAEETTP